MGFHKYLKHYKPLQQKGHMDFDFGNFWMKDQCIVTWQANVKSYNSQLSTLISAGNTIPSQIVSHELSLDDAKDAYKHFYKCDDGLTKIILNPEMKSSNKSAK